jgi:putative ABC transport system permease protein
MPLLARLSSFCRNIFARPRIERELDDELRAYVDQLASEHRERGMPAAEARRAALLQLGGIDQVKEEVRQVRTGQFLAGVLRDLRFGARTLRKTPAFSVVAVLALALGVGAGTAMFSVAYGILWRPLPYSDSGRVAVVFMRYYPRDFAFGTMCIRDYLLWKENNRAFETPALFRGLRVDLGGGAIVPEQVQGFQVTAGFFPTLGVAPMIGRTFAADEDAPGKLALAILSETIWKRRYGANPAILGQTILANGAPATVIGVMPAAFQFPRPETEIWTNLPLNPPTRYGPWFYRGIARLKPGVTFEQAEAETNTIAQRMMQLHPDYKRLVLPVVPLRDALLGPVLKPALFVLAGAVLLVLLIAIANVANLMLARATVRDREMALRLSLGAGRGRLIRQLLTESVLLSLIGGGAGVALAWGAIALVRAWNPGNLPFIDSVQLDLRALAFTAAASIFAGILFGLAPALQSARADLNSTLKEAGRSGSGGRTRARLRTALVICEIAVSLTLLVGAGLLLRSFVNLQNVRGGFTSDPRHLLSMAISPPRTSDPRVGLAFYDEVLRRVRQTPGVETADLSASLPPDRQGDADTFLIEGQSLAAGEINPIITDAAVGPDYFATLGVALRRGRYFDLHDAPDAPPVAIVSEAFAQRFFPGQDALGKRIAASGAGSGAPWMQIVGIVGNLKYLGLTADTDPAIYMPFAQSYQPRMYLIVRTSGDARRIAEEIRRQVRSADPRTTLSDIGTMDQRLDSSVSQPRFDTMLLALFAAIALALAAAGIYGLIAYSVAQRTHEIGVRMALGAARADVLRMVFRQGALMALAGIATGLAASAALARLLRTLLFGIEANDAFTFALAPAALLLVVFAAALFPSLRATRISPVVALRAE